MSYGGILDGSFDSADMRLLATDSIVDCVAEDLLLPQRLTSAIKHDSSFEVLEAYSKLAVRLLLAVVVTLKIWVCLRISYRLEIHDGFGQPWEGLLVS